MYRGLLLASSCIFFTMPHSNYLWRCRSLAAPSIRTLSYPLRCGPPSSYNWFPQQGTRRRSQLRGSMIYETGLLFSERLSRIVAGLAKLIGLAGETNIQGEEQKKLDVLSNEVFIKALVSSGRTCVLVSEEDEEVTFVDPSMRGRYCVVFDPLDGSSNIDCGVSIGTIFGIYMVEDPRGITLNDVLQPGKNMVAAGYCMYGSSCTLVLSTGTGVHGFTLDPSLGEFILTHPEIKMPKKGKIYSVNEGNAENWDGPTKKFVEKCKFPQDGSSPKSLRYIGSMVADVHRTLLYGGVFMYPADKKSPNGKLRLLYEVFPMSFLIEQAGGQAFTGKQRALDLVPEKIHQRSPVFLGSCDDIEEIKALYAAEESKA